MWRRICRFGDDDRRPNGLPPSNCCAVNSMEVQPDFRDLLALLNEHKVEYLIVGFGDVPVYYIGRAQYVANKRAAGRKKDLADIEALGED